MIPSAAALPIGPTSGMRHSPLELWRAILALVPTAEDGSPAGLRTRTSQNRAASGSRGTPFGLRPALLAQSENSRGLLPDPVVR